MVHTENRKVFSTFSARLNSGAGSDEAVLKMRPRDRRPVEMNVTVTPAPPNESGDWLWYFAPCAPIESVTAGRIGPSGPVNGRLRFDRRIRSVAGSRRLIPELAAVSERVCTERVSERRWPIRHGIHDLI